MDYKLIAQNILEKYNINPNILEKYDEPHRFYHNWEHIEYMLIKASIKYTLTDELVLAIIFHDIIYDPKSKVNEEKSADLFYSYVKNKEIYNAILDTETHQKPSSELSKQLCELDIYNLYDNFDIFYENSYKIFKEYQFVDFNIYKEERNKFLQKYNVDPTWIKAVNVFKPKIGVFAGSFNKFHKGHYNILLKAEKVFDKVIIARDANPEKNNKVHDLPEILKYRQIENYNGLLTDFIDSLNYEVTLIRGLRNITDLQFELKQYQFFKDFKPNISIISIFCDKEFEHISSSSIRLLEKYNKEEDYLL